MDFKISSDFKPTGDQPEAIKSIVTAINNDEKFSTLLGVTGGSFEVSNDGDLFKVIIVFKK